MYSSLCIVCCALQVNFHRNTHLDRYETIYKVGSAATGLVAIGQQADRMPCFRDDKATTKAYEYVYHMLVKKV